MAEVKTETDERGWWRVELHVSADEAPPFDSMELIQWLRTAESIDFDDVKLFPVCSGADEHAQ